MTLSRRRAVLVSLLLSVTAGTGLSLVVVHRGSSPVAARSTPAPTRLPFVPHRGPDAGDAPQTTPTPKPVPTPAPTSPPTPVPSIAPTRTPAPATPKPPAELLVNGDFEQYTKTTTMGTAGPPDGWEQSVPSLPTDGPFNFPASGKNIDSVFIDGTDPGPTQFADTSPSFWIGQQVSIPRGSGPVTLAYSEFFYSNSGGTATPNWTGAGTMVVTVTPAGGAPQTLVSTSLTTEEVAMGGTSWHRHTVDLTAWRGQTVAIRFTCTPTFVAPDLADQTLTMYLDDVTLLA